ncbi:MULTISPECIES: alpha-D-ribose 1-methylphosphonate 5-triphosphate diphosphatase [Vitreoscilla]|uniref:Alpha-D-ribose 1-methylphosphonate 5-triphosphate diphosphatase n=1 Tax=Vitreoscilla stercoraria TaxID=61 RepID=A0ABY4E840_VITST|nr:MULTISPECIES: alpha-D-ribose 1-methylphosphonate 5-triphosphate diphosphatase [Vitreoscilla]AUZ04826.1 phosphonate metabolism protein PhnM [Vitreoscilla sp. C1]UOO91506.1 alpha-D-ribose 1-methylphosphonate 5-triphosphate diphosphatase [Vitreoscilla stercoraria]
MSNEQILSNVKMVLADEVVWGSMFLQDGVIKAIDTSLSTLPQAQDFGGDYVIPGLVELHTDNLEKFMNPRPSVNWPSMSAVIGHDSQMIASGITTVFDALAVGDISPKGDRLTNLKPMLDAITASQQEGLTRAEHKIHLRCEVAHPSTYERFMALKDNQHLGLVSIMDHSPGQRQFAKIEKYREYYQGKYGLTDAQMDDFSELQVANAQKYSQPNRLSITEFCREYDLALASHDDATAAHVDESVGLGMEIAEFPTTEEAARLSHQQGLKVLMGAPNVVRGGSHSGNISAHYLAQLGLLDILSSDYYPNSLLQAAFMLTQEHIGYTLPQAIRTVSKNPAQSVHLYDRGEIAVGQIADLVHVKHQNLPLVQQVWKSGKRVF